MRRLRSLAVGMSLAAVGLATTVAAAAPAELATTAYAVADRIAGPDGGGWDYATFDPAAKRLYLARGGGVLLLNTASRHITPVFVPGQGVHVVRLVGDTGLAVSTNGGADTVTVFEAASGKVLGSVAVGKDPDAAAFEPKTGLIAVVNHAGGTVSLVDAARRSVVETIPVGGVLEAAVASGRGRVFVNVESKHQVAVVDAAAHKVSRRFNLAGCEEPSGIAYDARDRVVMSVCSNGVTKFLSCPDGTELATIKTGLGSDGLIFDARRRLLFVPAGRDGTLTVISVGAHRKPVVLQTIQTRKGARLGALDPATGRVYLPTAQFGPPVPPSKWPSVLPGTFEFLVVAPQLADVTGGGQ